MNKKMTEDILLPSINRFCLFPIQYETAFNMYLQQVASFWTVSEVDLAQDRVDYEKLSDDEKTFISTVLGFFAASDGIVNENLAQQFSCEVQVPEIRQFYGFQIGMETIHAHMYALMIETFEPDENKRLRLFNAVNDIKCVKSKAEWALKWINDDSPFAERLVAFACVEGIFFSASFCAIYFFKKRGKMPGLTFSNELIARDEGLHRDFACHVYSLLNNKLSQSRVHAIVHEAVECEKMYVDEALHADLIGMNATMMKTYVEYVADHLLVSLGYERQYKCENPFEWMDLISLNGKTNFFEKRVGEYQKAGVMQSKTSVQFELGNLDDDF
jgi:ribonucleotide reductase beta subunit family protein with ferritin-like domain